jgi:hypothetical protein
LAKSTERIAPPVVEGSVGVGVDCAPGAFTNAFFAVLVVQAQLVPEIKRSAMNKLIVLIVVIDYCSFTA